MLSACPFCSVTSQTLSEELESAEVAVIARLSKPAPPYDPSTPPDEIGPDIGMATFEVVEILRGADKYPDLSELRVVFFGENVPEKLYLINGIDAGIPVADSTQVADWTTPLPLSERGRQYVKQLETLPKKGAERLAFFQKHFEDDDPLLAQDAYDEFARAPYQEVIDLGPQMDRPQLLEWIGNVEIGPTRRRLYLTMLGVCGKVEDADQLEAMIKYDFHQIEPALNTMVSVLGLHGSQLGAPLAAELVRADVRRQQQCLDALIAAYLKLKGPEGLGLINERFLANPDAEYTDVYSTIMALRFHGEETDVLPREDLLNSMRLVLDKPDSADLVMTDLTRWEDWEVLDRLVQMFMDSDEDSWLRSPVISYVLEAARQPGDVGERATAALAEIEKIDPQGVKRAQSFSFSAFANAFTNNPRTAEKSDTGGAVSEDVTSADAQDGPAGDSTAVATAENSDLMATASGDGLSAPSRFTLIGGPVAACLLLMGVYALLLRSGDIRTHGGDHPSE